MTAAIVRLDLRLSAEDKERIRRAAALQGITVAAFVREAALRRAEAVLAHSPRAHTDSLAARLRGRVRARMLTDEIMWLTRGS
jgi:uncharacterized protein (DUF1778 family)